MNSKAKLQNPFTPENRDALWIKIRKEAKPVNKQKVLEKFSNLLKEKQVNKSIL